MRFQPDGIARTDTMGVYQGKIDQNVKMQSLSFCGRFKMFIFHGRDTFFQLRSNATDNIYMLKGGKYIFQIYMRILIGFWQTIQILGIDLMN